MGIGSGHVAASKQRQKQRQKKAIWQHIAALLMEAQASGKSEDLHHATAQLRRALDAEGWAAWGCPHWPRGQGTTTGKICWAWYKLQMEDVGMRISLSGALAPLAAAVVVASTIPATSQVARPLSALVAGDNDEDLVIQVRRGGGGGGGGFHRGGGGGMRLGGGGYRGGGMRVAQGGYGGRVMRVAQGGYREHNVHHGNRHAHRHHGHHHGGNHWNGWGWGAAGLAVGYGLGYGYGAYGYPYGYGYGYDYPAYGYDYAAYGYDASAAATCVRRVRVYDRSRGTYVIVRRQAVC
jgi:hypothetical protein